MELWNQLQEKNAILQALEHAQKQIVYDLETGGPSGATTKTGKMMKVLAKMYYQEIASADFGQLLTALKDAALEPQQQQIVAKLDKQRQKTVCIPEDEYTDYRELLLNSHEHWLEAKRQNKFELFADSLKQIVAFNKKYIAYQGYDENPYDALLDDYEEGLLVKQLDHFFSEIKKELVPFLTKLLASDKLQTIQENCASKGNFDVTKQKELVTFLLNYLKYDFTRGQLAESEHPFSLSFHNDDARVTTRYKKDDVTFAIFSILHEFGHAIYELNIAEALTQTPLGSGTSMGMHESQSRFYENVIGRKKAFWQPIYPVLQAYFSEYYGDISLDTYTQMINVVQRSLIRIEADELTYPLHIMVRYDLEKALFNDEITVDDLPEAWSDKMEAYLGVRPTTLSEGVLQDIHWSQGSFGYFPTYALGSAYAAQLYDTMKKTIDIETCLLKGDIGQITNFLKHHIHQYGASKTALELLEQTTGSKFDSQYYVQYLISKYTKLFLT